MGRYVGPRCKLCRREGVKLFLKGKKCTAKCTLDKKSYIPGQHWQKPPKLSDYGLHLREKQKLCRIYGIMENQFKNYFRKAKADKGMTGENLLIMLERRLDSVVYKMGLAPTRTSARQLVRHGHIAVNGKKLNIPSYLGRIGDVVSVRKVSDALMGRIKESMELSSGDKGKPSWLEVDKNNFTCIIRVFPVRTEISVPVEEQLVVEFYSK